VSKKIMDVIAAEISWMRKMQNTLKWLPVDFPAT
jgi:hypothetical protein